MRNLMIIVLFLTSISLNGQNRKADYHRVYLGTAVGVDETIFSILRLDYTFKYDRYFVQPYVGAHVSFFTPFGFAMMTSKSAYTGLNFKYVSVECGAGNHYRYDEKGSGTFNYTFLRAGIQTKYGCLKIGPTWVHKNGTGYEPLFKKIITIDNQQWTIGLMVDIKTIDDLY